MKKGKNKRLSALILSSVLALNLIMPFSSYAQEIPAQTAAETQAVHNNDTVSLSQQEAEVQKDSSASLAETERSKDNNASKTEAESSKDDNTSLAETEALKGSDASETDAKAQKDGISEPSDSDTQNETADTETENESQETESQSGAESESTAPLAYDVTKPVIESVELVQNGQTLKNGDTVELKVKAYDTESGIKSVTAKFGSFQEDNGYTFGVHQMTLACNDNSGIYTGTWTLENMASSEIFINEIEVNDNAGNYQTAEVSNSSEYLYSFNIQSEETVKITDFRFAANGKTLKEEDLSNSEVLGLSLTTDQPVAQGESICLSFKATSSDGIATQDFFMYPDESGKNFSFSNNSGSRPDKDISLTYTLDKIYIKKTNGRSELNTDAVGALSFTVEHKKDSEQPPEENTKPEITKIELTHNGEIVSPGDTVKLTVYVKSDKELSETAQADFFAAESITNNFQSISLTYDKSKGCYTGTLEITEDTYPCEWYLDSFSLFVDESNASSAYVSYDFKDENYPYYVNVSNDGTFAEQAYNVNINFVTLDADGNQVKTKITKENVGRRTSLKELGITLPEMSSQISGVSQTGWALGDTGKPFTEDSPILVSFDNESIDIYAVYDKLIVPVEFTYAANNGQWLTTEQLFMLEHGTTYGMLREKLRSFKPADALDGYPISDWDWNYTFSDDSVITVSTGKLSVEAQYNDAVLIKLRKCYFNKDGYYESIENFDVPKDVLAVSKGTTYKELSEQLKTQPAPESYSGLRFSHWDYSYYVNENTEIQSGDTIDMFAVYENYIVRYIIDDIDQNKQLIYCQTAEKGETVTVPEHFDGIDGKVQWADGPTENDTFVIGEVPVDLRNCYTFYGNGKIISLPEQPDTPDTDTPDTDTPGTEIPDTTVAAIIDEINNAQNGETVNVSMNGATVVSKDILEAAKGKNVNICLNMGGYTWTINGMNIFASDLKDINLEVRFDTNAVPSNIVKELAGDNPVRQLSLTHNGDFGFKATLTMNAGKEFSGKYGNLYYYDSDGKMVFMNAGKIAADGSVSLDFSHASDYVLVMSDKLMNQNDTPDNLNPSESTGQNGGGANNAGGSNGQNPVKTGDNAPLALCAVLMTAAACVFVIALKKRRFGK